MTAIKVSASQIQAWQNCRRLWGYTYIRGLRTSSEATIFGNKMHTHLEEHLEGREVDWESPEGLVAAKGRDQLHKLIDNRDVLVEAERSNVKLSHNTYNLIRDVVILNKSGKSVHLLDHKSCRNFNYALTPTDLHTDTQCVIYSRSLFLEYPEQRTLPATWLYYPKQKRLRAAHAVTTAIHRDRNQYEFEKIDVVASEIVKTRRAHPKDTQGDISFLPQNTNHCSAYGGCPHRDDCLSFKQVLAQPGRKAKPMKTTSQDLIAQLKASTKKARKPLPGKKAAAARAAQSLNPPEAAETPEPKPAEALDDVLGALDDSPEPKPAVCPKPPEPAPAAEPFTLLVGCIEPSAKNLTEVLTLLNEQFCEAYNASAQSEPNFPIVTYKSVPFGQGPGLFCKFIEDTGVEDLVGVYYADSRNWMVMDTLHVFEARAVRTIRAVG